jgi:hypothetical protein
VRSGVTATQQGGDEQGSGDHRGRRTECSDQPAPMPRSGDPPSGDHPLLERRRWRRQAGGGRFRVEAVQQPRQHRQLGQLGRAAFADGEVGLEGRALLRVDDAQDQDAERESRLLTVHRPRSAGHEITPRSVSATFRARKA